MGKLRQTWIRFTGLISWRNPNRQALLMSKFAATERGSSYDMLCALEKTQYPELRQKYLHHALDEARHARLFLERVRKASSRATAARRKFSRAALWSG